MPQLEQVFKATCFSLILAGAASVQYALADGVADALKNGGFEEIEGTMPRGWTVPPHLADRGTATADTGNVHSGKRSLMLAPNKRNKAEGFAVHSSVDVASVRGKEVTVSGFAALERMGGNPAAVLFKAGGDNWIVLSKDSEGKFVAFSKTVSVPKTATEASLLLFVGGTQGRVWFDDLSINTGPGTNVKAGAEPAPPAKMSVLSSAAHVNRINTDGWQDSVFISPDERELYFAYMPFAQNDYVNIYMGKLKPEGVTLRGPDRPGNHGNMSFETYVSVRNSDGTWGPPKNLNINSKYHLYSAKLTFDGKELYYGIREYEKNYGGDDIYFSRRNPDGSWTPPENLGPNINTKYREDTPCLSADGNTLYFGRSPTEHLGWEIFQSKKVNGTWAKAEKMPPPINQRSPETSANYQPFITADGKEFYFTRIQHIYRSKLRPDGTWGMPESILPQLDVSGHASVTGDGQRLYFLTAANKASLERHCWTIWVADRQKDGSWGNLRAID